jgi:hypothetical protein
VLPAGKRLDTDNRTAGNGDLRLVNGQQGARIQASCQFFLGNAMRARNRRLRARRDRGDMTSQKSQQHLGFDGLSCVSKNLEMIGSCEFGGRSQQLHIYAAEQDDSWAIGRVVQRTQELDAIHFRHAEIKQDDVYRNAV